MYVSKNMTYEELVAIVYTIVNYDVNKFNVDLSSISIVPGSTYRTFIRNDNDVQFMLREDRIIPQYNEQNNYPNPEVDNEANNDQVNDRVDNLQNVDEDLAQMETRSRHVQGVSCTPLDMPGLSEVRYNVTASATWVIPGADSYSFGINTTSTLAVPEPRTMIYKGSSIKGFMRCIRPVIAIDGTHLKGRFRGTMFVATAQDGNEQVYPIAFGYGDSENNLSWGWFLECLRGALGNIDDLIFIFDCYASIEVEISKVFPYATHTICCWHFGENMKKRFHRKDVADIMNDAARSYSELKYNRYMEELRKLHKAAFDYAIAAGPHKWSRVHYPQRRYRAMTTNVADCIKLMPKIRTETPIDDASRVH
ncbi:hypothetical protein LWI28_008484 [Acer negundo]|uniref:MULE transposase domain-containing protein n=1 Tax=Acer negundo TaxID=4023 RepID=A0AAD5NI63_ACENE|nr:hypothetical protein LWI28_008484 [Acer negundo]